MGGNLSAYMSRGGGGGGDVAVLKKSSDQMSGNFHFSLFNKKN